MDTKLIRKLVKENGTVVLVEEGHAPLIVREVSVSEEPQEVPISARWPKAVRPVQPSVSQDSVLERLNNEILALKEQIAQEEASVQGK